MPKFFAGLFVCLLLCLAGPHTAGAGIRSFENVNLFSSYSAPVGVQKIFRGNGFTPGNFVVCRIGPNGGTSNLGSASTSVYLEEYTSAGDFVSILDVTAAATKSARPFTVSGNMGSECHVTRSEDGRYLIIAGYGHAPGRTSISGTTSSAVPRVIARINGEGVVDTSTATTSFSGSFIYSAVTSDGSGFWISGGSSGIVWVPYSEIRSGTSVSLDLSSNRTLYIESGQLYVSTIAGSSHRVATVGNGLPTTPSNSITHLPGLTTNISPGQFYFADLSPTVAGPDTLYIADDGGATSGGIHKFSKVNGNWQHNGRFPGSTTPAINTSYFIGLAGASEGPSVTLFATRNTGSAFTSIAQLVRYTDQSGYNAAPVAQPLLVSTSQTRTSYRGVALTPIAPPANPGTFSLDSDAYSVGENDGLQTVVVNRAGGSAGEVSVDVMYGDPATAQRGTIGTATGGSSCATAGVDFISNSLTLTFADGEISKAAELPVCADDLYEGDEAFTLALQNPTGGSSIGTPNTATVTITDDDDPPTVHFSSPIFSTDELRAELGASGAEIVVVRSGATANSVSVDFGVVSGGTAAGAASCAEGADYIAPAGTLNFGPGEIARSFFVQTCADDEFEGNETVNLSLANIQGGALGSPAAAVLTIVENDEPFTEIAFESAVFADDESQTMQVAVVRTGYLGAGSSVMLTSVDGTARGGAGCSAGDDFAAAAAAVEFAEQESRKVIGVHLCADALKEPGEAFGLMLSGPSGAVLGQVSSAEGLINDTAASYANPAPIAFAADGPASVYPSTIAVTDGPSVVGNVRVTLFDVRHSPAEGLKILLAGPGGQRFVLMADSGGPDGLAGGATITFNDNAAEHLPDSGTIATGQFRPTNWLSTIGAFPDVPAGPHFEPGPGGGVPGTARMNEVFAQSPTDGIWRLYVRSEGSAGFAGGGEIAGGWGIELVAPSAASASVCGRVTTGSGFGIRNASVRVQGPTGFTETVTGSFGYYCVEGLQAGQTYSVSVRSKRFTFAEPVRVVSLGDSLTDVDFTAVTN